MSRTAARPAAQDSWFQGATCRIGRPMRSGGSLPGRNYVGRDCHLAPRRGTGALSAPTHVSGGLSSMVAVMDGSARQRWSTTDVESRHALAYWVDTVCKSFLEIDIDSPDRNRFQARLDQAEFGPATLYRIEAGTQTISRTPARI